LVGRIRSFEEGIRMMHSSKPLRRLALGRELREKRRKSVRCEISESDRRTWRVLRDDAFYAKA
jgi:hypothetical protein